MSKFSSFQLYTKQTDSTSTARVFEVEGQVSLDDMFAVLERRAQEGVIEHVTFESVGMTAEEIYA